jgi:HD-like signal output (HDOD) protein
VAYLISASFVRRSRRLSRRAGHDKLSARAKKVAQVVIKVQEAFKDPDYTPQKIACVVATESTPADRLLQMANSTAFTATGRVTALTLSPN